MQDISSKTCSKCKTEFPATEEYFHRHGNGYKTQCKKCRAIYRASYYVNHRKAELSVTAEYYRKNRGKLLAARKHQYQLSPETYQVKSCLYRKSHQTEISSYHKQYVQENLTRYRAWNAAKRARKRNATPLWVNKDILNQIYQNCPTGHEVDHIVPLSGRKVPVQVLGETFEFTVYTNQVCGLHVPWNLQYLTTRKNREKHNSLGAN